MFSDFFGPYQAQSHVALAMALLSAAAFVGFERIAMDGCWKSAEPMELPSIHRRTRYVPSNLPVAGRDAATRLDEAVSSNRPRLADTSDGSDCTDQGGSS